MIARDARPPAQVRPGGMEAVLITDLDFDTRDGACDLVWAGPPAVAIVMVLPGSPAEDLSVHRVRLVQGSPVSIATGSAPEYRIVAVVGERVFVTDVSRVGPHEAVSTVETVMASDVD